MYWINVYIYIYIKIVCIKIVCIIKDLSLASLIGELCITCDTGRYVCLKNAFTNFIFLCRNKLGKQTNNHLFAPCIPLLVNFSSVFNGARIACLFLQCVVHRPFSRKIENTSCASRRKVCIAHI